jgi:hypothetical protein
MAKLALLSGTVTACHLIPDSCFQIMYRSKERQVGNGADGSVSYSLNAAKAAHSSGFLCMSVKQYNQS